MDVAAAEFLTSPAGLAALAELRDVADPSSLAVAENLRRRFEPAEAAALTSQLALRRRARTKFGDDAERLLFTPDGLEQATRPAVARWRAEQIASTGRSRVVDLGCGIGADASAFATAGLDVVAVERDQATAVLAQHNTGRDVILGDALDVTAELVGPDDVVFLDPARRGDRGRTWDVSQFTPPWSFVEESLRRTAVVKLGPGLPHRMIPDGVDACWVSDHGDVVEVCLSNPGLLKVPGGRAAVLLPGGTSVRGGRWDVPVASRVPEVGELLIEPDGALIRAGAVTGLAERISARAIADGIAYLVGTQPAPPEEAASFEILDVLPWREKDVRAWLREHKVGTLEIKKRGIEVDPATLRKRLLAGRKKGTGGSVTLIISPTSSGARAFLTRRVGTA